LIYFLTAAGPTERSGVSLKDNWPRRFSGEIR